jgi:Protein of unknown function (DUF3108).
MFLMLSSFVGGNKSDFITVKNTSFGKGEVLNYDVHFGFFHVGKATTVIENKTFTMNARPCYKIDAYGETLGFVSWITKVKDQWGAYIDTAAIVTHVSYRKIREGRYRKDELITYNHEKDEAEVKELNDETGLYGEPKIYPTPNHVRDMVGGFMYLRVIDFKKYKKGDTLTVHGFFQDEAYHFKIIYSGKEVVKTSIGKVPCHKLVPIMPDNKVFDGENSITCYISDDGNQIPIKIHAKMFIGGTGIELSGFRGLRNQLKVIK